MGLLLGLRGYSQRLDDRPWGCGCSSCSAEGYDGSCRGRSSPAAQRIPPLVADVLPPPPPLPTDMGQMLTFLQQILETHRAQAEAQQSRQTRYVRAWMMPIVGPCSVEQRAPHSGMRTRYGDIQDFKKLGPRDFSGTEGVVYADDWFEDIERQMRASRLADD
ncbi:uncharacterized protein M6B38_359830 [Iris pallida]|uniref:Big gastrin n=1 Tax=Iris pallida TaxID=29817 RepID=A0AAX6GLF5_IRIPA|nr:uncharacterized protein M6B38_359830 [Iris pallida]